MSIQDQADKAECRLIVKMVSRHGNMAQCYLHYELLLILRTGMTKTYRLTYESVEIMHALFDKSSAPQGWRISSRVLREYIEYFGPKTEQLDILAQEGKVVFTSFTEKIQDGQRMNNQSPRRATS